MNSVNIDEFMRVREMALQRLERTAPAVKSEPLKAAVTSKTTVPQLNSKAQSADYYQQKTFELRMKAGQGLPVRKTGNLFDVCA